MGLLSAIALTLLLVCSSHSTEINVTFELRENDLNEVIFVDDEGIVLLCCVFGASYEYKRIRIGHETREDILTTFATPNCRTYTINKVSLNDGGVYTCNISYLDGNGITRHKTKSLYLNVQDNQTPYCFRNGTPGNHYCVGDVLLMSCYCLAEMPCMWIQNVPGSRFSSIINSYDTGSRSNKMISRILVEVGSVESPTNATYICYHSQLVRQRCSIGPQNESSTDLVISSHEGNTLTDCLHGELVSESPFQTQEDLTPSLSTFVQTSSRGSYSPTTLMSSSPGNTNKHDGGFVAASIGLTVTVSVVCILLATIVLIVLYFWKFRINRNNGEDPGTTHLYYSNKIHNTRTKDEIVPKIESGDSQYYTIECRDVSQTGYNSEPRVSLESDTYMRSIIQE